MPRYLWPGSLLILFLLLATYQLELPGLHYDEAFEVVPAMQLLKNQPVNAFRGGTITFLGKNFPLMTQDYIGAVNTYGSLPFLAAGGITVFSLRAYSIFVGLITLVLVYGFTVELTRHRPAGLAALAMLAVNPTFIFWTRQGIFVTAINAAIGVGAAWCWLKWWRSKKYRFALLGAFLFGLGIYAKFLFLWLIAALFGAMVIHQWLTTRNLLKPFSRLLSRLAGEKQNASRRLFPGRIAGLAFAGAAGCWPLIVYNLRTGGTFMSVGQNAGVSYYGVNNADVLSNLTTRMSQFVTLLSSSHFWYLGEVHTNWLAPLIFGLALIAALRPTIKQAAPISLIPFVVVALVVIESIVTVSALWVTHFALLMVWPAIAMAVVAGQIAQQKPAQTVKLGLTILFALLIASEAKTTWDYHQSLTESGGLSDHSDAVYDMAAWLDENASGPVVAMDWGLTASTTYLTEGRITPIEVFGYDWVVSDRFEQVISPRLEPKQAVFLWRSPDEVIFDRSADFKSLYQPLQLEETILEAFYERNGRPILGATQLVPVGTAGNKPQ